MDPNHPSNTSVVPGHVSPPPNQPVPTTFVTGHVTASNQTIRLQPLNQHPRVHSHPDFQPQQPMPQSSPRPQPQHQSPPSQLALVPAAAQPSINYPPYDDMICDAIRDINNPDGSSKFAISTYIERSHADLPPSHATLMTYHLKTLRKTGVLTMVNKAYKLAPPPPPPLRVADVADLMAPRSEVPLMSTTSPLDLLAASASASQPQKRGPGRPPKAMPEAPQEQQPINAQPELPVNNPTPESAKRGPGRPKRDGSVPTVPAAGWVLALPAAGAPESMQRGMKRGPGRPPKNLRNRPRKSATPMSIRTVTGTLESAYGELKRKLDFACEKAKEILDVLNAGIESNDVIAISQARQELEGLIPILTVEPRGVGQVQPHAVEEVEAPAVEQPQAVEEVQTETMEEVPQEEAAAQTQAVEQPQAMEEVQPEEAAGQTEAETQGEEHGQEVEEGEQAQLQPQPQTEAEAMKEEAWSDF